MCPILAPGQLRCKGCGPGGRRRLDLSGSVSEPSVPMPTDMPTKPRYGDRLAIAACSLLLVLFMTLSYSAVLTKSATYDEPMHALAAWAHVHLGDFRINFEDPPLWQYWATLPNGSNAIRFDQTDLIWT